LSRGIVSWIQSTAGGRAAQVGVLALVDSDEEAVEGVIREASRWPEFMKSLEVQTQTPTGPGTWELEWKVSVPLGSVRGRSRMVETEAGFDVTTTGGDITNGRALWSVLPIDDERSLLVHQTYSDLRAASPWIRALLDAEPLLEHGMLTAASTVVVSRVRDRAEGHR
ncbi:MAG: hypothetical protein HC923_07260, partial [Myxococcales bacterium]|nr:hypothetical protein [Myxococcales bacterium]